MKSYYKERIITMLLLIAQSKKEDKRMKSKLIKKMLTTALAGVIVAGNVMTASATTQSSTGVDSAANDAKIIVSGGTPSSISPSAPASPAAARTVVYTSSSVSLGGRVVKSTVGGVFIAPNVNGLAVTTPLATINADFGLTAGQSASIMVLEANAVNSPKSYAVAQNAAAGLNGSVVAMLNLEFGFRQNGRYADLADNGTKAELAVGLPKTADTSKTYKVLKIKEGGSVTVMDDLDNDPNTVTIAFGGGKAAYALVAVD